MTKPVVVIPSWNGWSHLQQCLGGFAREELHDVLVVDNGSVDGTVEQLRLCFPEVQVVVLPTNVGFAQGVNEGIAAAPGRDVVLLNNDAVPDPGWLQALTRAAVKASPRVGFVTSKILREQDGRIDSVGDVQTWAGLPIQRGHGEPDRGQYDGNDEVFSGCGGATWYRREMLDDVGLFDERFFAYYEDVDLCSRAQLRGWTGTLAREAVVRHAVSATSVTIPGFKRYQSTRNGWWLLLRTVPAQPLRSVFPRFMLMNLLLLMQAVLKGELRAALRGHAHALRGLPRVLRERRAIQSGATVSAELFASKLAPAGLKRTIRQGIGSVLWTALGHPVSEWEDTRSGDPFNADAAIRYEQLGGLIPSKSERVLEVGSGSAGLTAYFELPFVVGCDLDYAATSELDSTDLRRITGAAMQLPFRDGAFDVVVCMDALEHFPADQRATALRELIRVGSPGGVVLLAAPMGRPAEWADRRVNSWFNRRHHRDHPWLVEHLEAPLPRIRDVRSAVSQQPGTTVTVHRNAWLPLWLLVQWLSTSRWEHAGLLRLLAYVAPRMQWAPAYRLLLEIRL